MCVFKSAAFFTLFPHGQEVFGIFVCLFVFINFIYLYLAALGIRCCARSFSSWGEQELLLVTVLLIAVASLVAEHGL